MKRLAWDIETDGLLDQLTRVHSLVLKDLDTGYVLSCADQKNHVPIKRGLEVLAEAEQAYGHNIIGFDIPALAKVYPDWTYRGTMRDTLVAAQMRFAHIGQEDQKRKKFPRGLTGRHSLEAWGHRLGLLKGEFGKTTDWSEWTEEMQTYCVLDVEVTAKLVEHLRTEGMSPESVEIEEQLAYYLREQEANGWPVDMKRLENLHAELSAKREGLSRELKAEFGGWYADKGEFVPARDNSTLGYYEGCPMTKIEWTEFNANSRDHIADRLIRLHGWEPTKLTPTGKPVVDESTLAEVGGRIGGMLNDYLLVGKRLGQVAEGESAWMKHVVRNPETGMYHIHHRVLQNKAITHRAAHASPNLAQVPSAVVDDETHELVWGERGKWGSDSRAVFTVPTGWVQVGADASGLELRCLAHYMNDPAYTQVILNGDVHQTNADALGISRSLAKRWIYAYLYGAGDELLGAIVEPGATQDMKRKLGKKLRTQFERNIPALGRLVAGVKEAASTRGWLKLPDGRRVFIRHQHAALNSLLQGSGAILCKAWLCEYARALTTQLGPQGWRGQWAALGWIHDETQLAVRPAVQEVVCVEVVEAIRRVGERFQWRCALDGEAKVGRNWAETH